VCKTSFSIAGEGTWSINQLTGVAQFTVSSSVQAGELTPVMYRVTDAVGQTTMAELAVFIPQAATAVADTSINAIDVDQTISPLGNDTPGGGTVFNASTVKLCAVGQVSPFCAATTIVVPNEGTYSVRADGSVVFDPSPIFTGYATTISYQVTDSLGRTYSASITPRVTTTPPVSQSDAVTLQAGGTATFRSIFGTNALVAPASGGPNLRPETACLVDPVDNTCGVSLSIDGEGTYSLDPVTGVVTFTALPDAQIGQRTTVTYRITDADGFTAQGTFTPTIRPQANSQPSPSDPGSSPAQPSLAPSVPGSSPAQPSLTPDNSVNVKEVSSTSRARASSRKSWTRPSMPLSFNPTDLARPSRGAKFIPSRTRLWDKDKSLWSLEIENEDGRWMVKGNRVRFVPRDGFLGQTSIQFAIQDSEGKTAQAKLTAVVDEKTAALPATGAPALSIMLTALFLVAIGSVVGIVGRGRRSSVRIP
jgi:CshA-type fibril repeat protein